MKKTLFIISLLNFVFLINFSFADQICKFNSRNKDLIVDVKYLNPPDCCTKYLDCISYCCGIPPTDADVEFFISHNDISISIDRCAKKLTKEKSNLQMNIDANLKKIKEIHPDLKNVRIVRSVGFLKYTNDVNYQDLKKPFLDNDLGFYLQTEEK